MFVHSFSYGFAYAVDDFDQVFYALLQYQPDGVQRNPGIDLSRRHLRWSTLGVRRFKHALN